MERTTRISYWLAVMSMAFGMARGSLARPHPSDTSTSDERARSAQPPPGPVDRADERDGTRDGWLEVGRVAHDGAKGTPTVTFVPGVGPVMVQDMYTGEQRQTCVFLPRFGAPNGLMAVQIVFVDHEGNRHIGENEFAMAPGVEDSDLNGTAVRFFVVLARRACARTRRCFSKQPAGVESQ